MTGIERQRATKEAKARVAATPPVGTEVLRYVSAESYPDSRPDREPDSGPDSAAGPSVRRTPAGPATRPAGSRLLLVGLELVVGANAVYGGIALFGNGMGMPTEWLDGTPFGSWRWPGALLLVVVALPMITAAAAELGRRRWAYPASLAAGLLQVGWILGQWAVLRRFFFLQPVMLGCGLAVAGLAWWYHRGQRRR